MNIQMRCPDCHKLYQTQVRLPMTIDQQSKMNFTCEQCHQQFSLCDEHLSRQNELTADIQLQSSTIAQPAGLFFAQTRLHQPNQMNAKKGEVVQCPRCQTILMKNQLECVQCGVIISKALGGKPHLEKKWQDVLHDFENQFRHQLFIQSCEEQDQLLFALEKYRDLYDVLGESQICAQKIDELEAKMKVRHFDHLQMNHKDKTNYFDSLIPLSPYLISFGLIFMGLLKPGNRNFIGFGVMLFILVTGIRFFWLGPQKFLNFFDGSNKND